MLETLVLADSKVHLTFHCLREAEREEPGSRLDLNIKLVAVYFLGILKASTQFDLGPEFSFWDRPLS